VLDHPLVGKGGRDSKNVLNSVQMRLSGNAQGADAVVEAQFGHRLEGLLEFGSEAEIALAGGVGVDEQWHVVLHVYVVSVRVQEVTLRDAHVVFLLCDEVVVRKHQFLKRPALVLLLKACVPFNSYFKIRVHLCKIFYFLYSSAILIYMNT
jgi:hypothetical protein